MASNESIPQVWDDDRDSEFFRVTAPLFDTAFCYGASVLLASYDTDDACTATAESFAEFATAEPISFDQNTSTVKGATR